MKKKTSLQAQKGAETRQANAKGDSETDRLPSQSSSSDAPVEAPLSSGSPFTTLLNLARHTDEKEAAGTGSGIEKDGEQQEQPRKYRHLSLKERKKVKASEHPDERQSNVSNCWGIRSDSFSKFKESKQFYRMILCNGTEIVKLAESYHGKVAEDEDHGEIIKETLDASLVKATEIFKGQGVDIGKVDIRSDKYFLKLKEAYFTAKEHKDKRTARAILGILLHLFGDEVSITDIGAAFSINKYQVRRAKEVLASSYPGAPEPKKVFTRKRKKPDTNATDTAIDVPVTLATA
jgi:hypothetical protein